MRLEWGSGTGFWVVACGLADLHSVLRLEFVCGRVGLRVRKDCFCDCNLGAVS